MMMMPWLILGVVSIFFFFFRVSTASANGNGVIEHNSARELGRSIFYPSKRPLTQAQEIILVCKLFYYLNNAFMLV